MGILNKYWTKYDVLNSWIAWPMIIAIVAQSMFVTIFFFQQVTLGIENNWSSSQFAILIPFYTITSIISTFIASYIIDKFGVRIVLPYYLVPGVKVTASIQIGERTLANYLLSPFIGSLGQSFQER